MNKNKDETSDTIYAINSEQQHKIFHILNELKIFPRKRQNINFITISVGIQYFDSDTSGGKTK